MYVRARSRAGRESARYAALISQARSGDRLRPIVIGQAASLTIPGTQACRVLRPRALRSAWSTQPGDDRVTDPEHADYTYVEPITPAFVER